MKKLFLLALIGISNILTAQITKGFWLMGGDVSLAYKSVLYTEQPKTYNDLKRKSTIINLSPNIGYFPIDKLAVGFRGNIEKSWVHLTIMPSDGRSQTTSNSNNTTLSISPFARYYFLDTENTINVFAEGEYEFYVKKMFDKEYRYNLKGGLVYFLNNTVGLEGFIKYSHHKTLLITENPYTINITEKNNEILLGIGLQIHLEKRR